MKKLNLLFHSLLVVIVLAFVGCKEEPPIPNPIGPDISLSLTSADTIPNGVTFTVELSATQGDALLKSLEITQNGTVITDVSGITLAGDPMGGNPTPIGAPANTGFTWEIAITASDEPGVNTYGFTVTDEGGLTSVSLSVDIVTYDPGTPVSEMTMILLSNQGGPTGTGGVDLHTGVGTGTKQPQDSIADLKDNGIDINKIAAENWIQRISPINGSNLIVPDAGFSYDAVTKKEEIATAFEFGTEITLSDVVQIGDEFLVKSAGTFFAVKVTNVVVTTTDNKDYYELSVKQ